MEKRLLQADLCAYGLKNCLMIQGHENKDLDAITKGLNSSWIPGMASIHTHTHTHTQMYNFLPVIDTSLPTNTIKRQLIQHL